MPDQRSGADGDVRPTWLNLLLTLVGFQNFLTLGLVLGKCFDFVGQSLWVMKSG